MKKIVLAVLFMLLSISAYSADDYFYTDDDLLRMLNMDSPVFSEFDDIDLLFGPESPEFELESPVFGPESPVFSDDDVLGDFDLSPSHIRELGEDGGILNDLFFPPSERPVPVPAPAPLLQNRKWKMTYLANEYRGVTFHVSMRIRKTDFGRDVPQKLFITDHYQITTTMKGLNSSVRSKFLVAIHLINAENKSNS